MGRDLVLSLYSDPGLRIAYIDVLFPEDTDTAEDLRLIAPWSDGTSFELRRKGLFCLLLEQQKDQLLYNCSSWEEKQLT